MSSTMPAQEEQMANSYKTQDGNWSDLTTLTLLFTDENFLHTLNIELKEGRFFQAGNLNDTLCIVLNETAVKMFNLKNPVGQTVIQMGRNETQHVYQKVIGVVKDCHFRSLKEKIEPMGFLYVKNTNLRYLAIRVSAGQLDEAIQNIETQWQHFLPGEPFQYFLLDQNIDKLHKEEKSMSKILSAITFIAILIASLGLLGLASYTSEQKIREIGIRKSLGASVSNIAFMLTKTFARLVLLANIIAWPIAYWAISSWLNLYAFRTELQWWFFFFA